MSNKTLICILGPTAVGKTAAAIQLAKSLSCEIISADSRQFYKEVSIGTAKPSDLELAEVPHHFIGHKSVTETYNAGEFERDALALINQLFQKNQYVVLVGGSGLYVKAVYDGLHDLPKADEELRAELAELFAQKGIEPLQQMLQELDKKRWEQIDQQNPQRLMRAIEIAKGNQAGFTQLTQHEKPKRTFTVNKYALQMPREQLYARIEKRVDLMIEAGLEAEAKRMIPFKETYAMQTVGYKEFFDFFDGIAPREKAIELIKQHTRNYAKKQLTWLRREADINWIESVAEIAL